MLDILKAIQESDIPGEIIKAISVFYFTKSLGNVKFPNCLKSANITRGARTSCASFKPGTRTSEKTMDHLVISLLF